MNGCWSARRRYISNGGIADFYVTFARTGEGEGARGLSAFIVPADARSSVAERIEVIAPHPLARLKYDNVRIPADAIVGEPGEGFRIGMETLNLFRVTVGAAALGFARRALDEALAWAKSRRLGSGTLADNAVTQAKLADMALAIDASALLIYRAAWQQDEGGADNRRAAAMAKLHATEAAQQVIDAAVQMHGGAGVTRGVKVEELYRDIRALRIYEGASEVQRQIIARDLLKGDERMKILQPPNWPRPKGYSNGISAKGRMIFTAGVVGWDENESFPEYTLHGQFARALRNTLADPRRGRRRAAAHRPHDLLRHRPSRISELARRDRRRVARDHGAELSGDGAGRSEGPGRKRGQGRDRNDGGGARTE